MNKTQLKWIFCRVVMQVDWIPRYGRLYRYQGVDEQGDMKLGPARWEWQRRGRWGMYLLDRMGLLWWFIDEGIRRQDAASGSARGRTDNGD